MSTITKLNSNRAYLYLLQVFFGLYHIDNLVKLGSEKIKAGQNCTIRTQSIAFHNVLVFHAISNVNVAWEINFQYCGIQIYVVSNFVVLVKKRNESLTHFKLKKRLT